MGLQVPFVPRAAAAPAPAGLAADISSMPRFWSWGGWGGGDSGSVAVGVSVADGSGEVTVDVRTHRYHDDLNCNVTSIVLEIMRMVPFVLTTCQRNCLM